MNIDEEKKYTKSHEWVSVTKNSTGEWIASVGITEFAAKELGEIVFVDLPKIGATYNQGEMFCVLESTKAASDVFAPLSGSILSINLELQSDATIINKDPFKLGWIASFKLTNIDEYKLLLSQSQYLSLIR